MKYLIYIDESGSLNDKNREKTLFSVCLVIIKKENHSKLKYYFKKRIKQIKKEFQMEENEELKAHNFVRKKRKEKLFNFLKNLKNINDFSGYILNENINSQWLQNKNVTYNFIVKCVLERIIENLNIQKNDKIFIKADKREMNIGSSKFLKEYLQMEFVLKNIIKEINICFVDSQNDWSIQMADLFSYKNYDETKNMKNMKNKRHVY